MEKIYYHGGPAGLKVGEYLLPPSETNAPCLSSFGAAGVHRRDRVYLIKDSKQALLYAGATPKGRRAAIYIAEPEGEIEADPDWQGAEGISIQCRRARIIAVRKVRGKFVRKIRRQVHGVLT